MTVLTTPRLRLRQQQESDAAVFHRLWIERDPRVPAHRRIDAAGHPAVADVAARIRTALAGPEPRLLTVERIAEADVIGYCGIQLLDSAPLDDPELAFELLRAVHGRGYATEAAQALVEWARAAGYRRLQADVWDWNTASRAVLRKVGFRETDAPRPLSEHVRRILTVLDLAG